VTEERAKSGRLDRWTSWTAPGTTPFRFAWVPLILLLILLVVAVSIDSQWVYDPDWLLLGLNTVFVTVVPLIVAVMAVTAYRTTGVVAVLAIGTGMVALMWAGTPPAVLLKTEGADAGVAMHNSSVLLASLCFFAASLAGAFTLPPRLPGSRGRQLVVAYAAAALCLGVILVLVLTGEMPTFFVQGKGPTHLRQIVLGAGLGLFLLAAIFWWQTYLRTRVAFLRWYALGLALFTVGLAAIFLQRAVGDLVGWIGRSGQFLAMLYLLVAVLHALRAGTAGRAEHDFGVSLLQATLPYRPLVESASDAIVVVDDKNCVMYWNDTAQQLFGYDASEVFGSDLLDAIVPTTRREATRAEIAALSASDSADGKAGGHLELTLVDRDSHEFPADTAFFANQLGPGRLTVCMIQDITGRKYAEDELLRTVDELACANADLQRSALERQRLATERDALIGELRSVLAELERRVEERTAQLATANEELAHRLHHDPLTGLPNRDAFMDHLSRAMTRATRDGTHVAVLFLDLDRLKLVNDSYGQDAGDRHLCGVARVLSSVIRPGDLVARFSGDEFVILLDGSSRIYDVVQVATRIQAALAEPVPLRDEVGVVTTASIGIAISEREDAEGLVAHADVAMYRAKESGRARYEVYNEDLRATVARRLLIERTLRAAPARHELDVEYQPEIDISSGRVAAVEALARWNHPALGRLRAGAFIPIAEACGLVPQVGGHVMRQAFAQAQRWSSTAPVSVAVNLSAKQLARDDIVDEVSGLLDGASCPPDTVCLEITETSLMVDGKSCRRRLDQLHCLGVKIAIDDFGTGYSSLAYLTRFPIDILKIDKSLIDGLGVERDDTVVVQAIIRLAHALDLTSVAEGVETADQLRVLTDLGCDMAQGYYIAAPASAVAVTPLLRGRPPCA